MTYANRNRDEDVVHVHDPGELPFAAKFTRSAPPWAGPQPGLAAPRSVGHFLLVLGVTEESDRHRSVRGGRDRGEPGSVQSGQLVVGFGIVAPRP